MLKTYEFNSGVKCASSCASARLIKDLAGTKNIHIVGSTLKRAVILCR